MNLARLQIVISSMKNKQTIALPTSGYVIGPKSVVGVPVSLHHAYDDVWYVGVVPDPPTVIPIRCLLDLSKQ